MKKGIVMDVDESFLTLLTPEGEFLRARKQHQSSYSIGEEILFTPIEKVKTNRFTLKQLFVMKPLPIAIAAMLLFFGTFVPMYQNNKAYAYMSIDVNPSLELGLNKNMQVVKLSAFNSDGKKIIAQLDHWKKKDVSQLTQTIFDEIKDKVTLRNIIQSSFQLFVQKNKKRKRKKN